MRRPERPSFARIASQWLLAAALAGVLVLFFAFLVAGQLTSRDTGERLQRRAVAALVDIDRLLPAIEEDLHEAAAQAEDDTVRVPGFPIHVDVAREEAETLSGEALHERLLDEAGARLYEDGMSSWAAADPEAVQSIDRVSAAGAVHRGLGLVRDTWHTVFIVAAIVSGIAALLLAAGLLVSVRGTYMRLISLGGVVLAAALASLAAAVATRFALKTAQSDGDPFVDRILEIGIDAAGIAIQDYLLLATLGALVVAVAGFLAWLESRPRARRPSLGERAAPPSPLPPPAQP